MLVWRWEDGIPSSRLQRRDAPGEELGLATSHCWSPALLGGKQGRGRDASVTFKNIYIHTYIGLQWGLLTPSSGKAGCGAG